MRPAEEERGWVKKYGAHDVRPPASVRFLKTFPLKSVRKWGRWLPSAVSFSGKPVTIPYFV